MVPPVGTPGPVRPIGPAGPWGAGLADRGPICPLVGGTPTAGTAAVGNTVRPLARGAPVSPAVVRVGVRVAEVTTVRAVVGADSGLPVSGYGIRSPERPGRRSSCWRRLGSGSR